MCKHIINLFVLLFSATNLWAVEISMSSDLYNNGKQYERQSNYSEANRIFATICNEYPLSQEAYRAKLDLEKYEVIVSIQSGDFAAASQMVNRIIELYDSHPDIAEAVYIIASQYELKKEIDRANTLYSLIEQRWLEALANSNVAPDVRYKTARRHEKSDQYTKAEKIYKQITRQYPSDPVAKKVVFDVARIAVLKAIESREFDQAKTLTYELINSYDKRSDLPETVYIIAAHLKESGQTEFAMEFYSIIEDRWLNGLVDSAVTADVRYETAKGLLKSGQYEKSRSILKQIIRQYPDSKVARKAVLDVAQLQVLRAIKSRDYALAKELTLKMVSTYGQRASLPEYLNTIAAEFDEAGEYERAVEIYNRIENNWPQSPEVTIARMGKEKIDLQAQIAQNKLETIESLVVDFEQKYSGSGYRFYEIIFFLAEKLYVKGLESDYSLAAVTADRLLGRYSSSQIFDKTIFHMVTACLHAGEVAKAETLCQKALEQKPEYSNSIYFQGSIAKIDIRQGHDDQDTNDFIATLQNHSGEQCIGKVLLIVGEEYYYRAQDFQQKGEDVEANESYERAISLMQQISESIAGSIYKYAAFYVIGLCQQGLEKYALAADAFQRAYEANPDFEYADYCLFAQADCYNSLAISKSLSAIEAKEKMTQLYLKLISEHPQSRYIANAEWWLKRHESVTSQ